MALPKPTTSQLMALLPQWPISKNTLPTGGLSLWHSKNVPWAWTPEEFEIQTRMLATNDCPACDMVAWLIHGIHWVKTFSINGEMGFDEKLRFWIDHRCYLQAWVRGSQASVAEETLQVLCRNLDWHPVLQYVNFASTMDDFYWAREIRQHRHRTLGNRKPLTSVGGFELAHISTDRDFQFSCATHITKNIGWRTHKLNEPIAVMSNIIKSSAFHTLPSPQFKRFLLMTSAKQGNPRTMHPSLSDDVLSVWTDTISNDEQTWWIKKSRSMSFTREQSEQLLEQGIHPLSFVHRGREKDLAVLQAINPDAFRYGYILNGLLSNDTPEPLPLPDLDENDIAF